MLISSRRPDAATAETRQNGSVDCGTMESTASKEDHMTDAAERTRVIESPIGPLTLTAQDGALTGVDFGAGSGPGEPARPAAGSPGSDIAGSPGSEVAGSAGSEGPPADPDAVVLAAAAAQLTAYFAGELREFDLPLQPRGTEFQLGVWRALGRIPYGETRSYSELAAAVGRPAAARAVGRANGQNPIAVVVPCHRVIGADASLTGYAGGLDTKSSLLALEAGHAAV
jgi:methylated-DNA-[protein]-cysteine S-methyltransferase